MENYPVFTGRSREGEYMAENIWKRCERGEDILRIEKEVLDFLARFGLEKKFPVEKLEADIYSCNPGEEELIFDAILGEIKNGTLADLKLFDDLFRKKFFAHVPQKVLGGQSPVRYTLFLKKMKDGGL